MEGISTIRDMSQTNEADVALINVAGGESRMTPPPGVLALSAPRRSARGRSADLFFVCLSLSSAELSPPGQLDSLAHMAADAYYGTPGSVTAGLREAIEVVNDSLLETNEGRSEGETLSGYLIIAIIRNQHYYLAQSGASQAILIRPGNVTSMSSEQAAERPLGITIDPYVRYYHLEACAEDLVILVPSGKRLWSETTLSGLAGLNLIRAVERLTAVSSTDLTGIALRMTPPSVVAEPQVGQSEHIPVPSYEAQRSAQIPRRPKRRKSSHAKGPSPVGLFLVRAIAAVKDFFSSVFQGVTTFLIRMAPGFAEPPRDGQLKPRMLATTAIIVPLVVVAIAALMYLRKGRNEQFMNYLYEAQAVAQAAEMISDPLRARDSWIQSIELLNKAEKYSTDEVSRGLRNRIQAAIDSIDLVYRIDFQEVIQGGFQPDSIIKSMAVTATDLYVLDETRQAIYHAWSTGRFYESDNEFKCLNGRESVPGWTSAVDLVIQPEPGALGAEGVVAIDEDGTLIYCAPGRASASGQLPPPDIGWGRIQAIDVFGNSLYILDPERNAIWIYDASGGLFTGSAALYFIDEVPDLSDAIDLAMAQDELYILYADGHLDHCRRIVTSTADSGTQIRVEYEQEFEFQDERLSHPPVLSIPNSMLTEMEYSPPPEPSIFILDTLNGSIYQFSMRLVYQGQYKPAQNWQSDITTFALGPMNDLFIAIGDEVYFAHLPH